MRSIKNLSTVILRLSGLFSVVFLCGSFISFSSPADMCGPDPLKVRISTIVKGKSKVGLLVGLIKDGKRHVFRYGRRSLTDNRVPDGDTVFEIGSITKTFTGTILADMVLKKELSDTDPVSKFIPQDTLKLPLTDGKEITLRDLAQHVSGIPAMPDNIPDLLTRPNPLSGYTPEMMFQSLNRCKLDFPTGSRHSYSNSGFGLLAYILTVKSEKTYEQLVTDRIFTPLGMTNSTVELTEKQKKNISTGYSFLVEEQPYWTATDILSGSGFIKSTLNDMFLYLEAVMGKETVLKQAFGIASSELRDGYPGTWIGYGWYTELMKNGEKIVCHNGATGGFYAFIGFSKSTGVGLIILSNHKNYRELDPLGYEILTKIR